MMSQAMHYYHPFQKLCYVGSVEGEKDLLLAATGHRIVSFNLSSGRPLSVWPSDVDVEDESDVSEHDQDDRDQQNGGPPRKKPRLDPNDIERDAGDSPESVEIVAERAKGQRRMAKVLDSKLPNVSHLIATRDKRHVIVVTAEDKCIRVFELRKGGRLKVMSER